MINLIYLVLYPVWVRVQESTEKVLNFPVTFCMLYVFWVYRWIKIWVIMITTHIHGQNECSGKLVVGHRLDIMETVSNQIWQVRWVGSLDPFGGRGGRGLDKQGQSWLESPCLYFLLLFLQSSVKLLVYCMLPCTMESSPESSFLGSTLHNHLTKQLIRIL